MRTLLFSDFSRGGVGTVGALFPRHSFEFTVHSVFDRAVNLRAQDERWLVSLVLQEESLHPRAAVLPGVPFPHRGFVTGRKGTCPSLGPPRWDGTVAAARGGLKSRLARARRVLNELRAEKHLDSGPFSAVLLLGAAMLETSFDRGAAVLVGAGEGLTPAGDDFLAGWLASRWIEGSARGAGDQLIPLLGRTNEISAALLAAAAEGQFSRGLVDLASSLTAGSPTVEAALDALGNLGHSSGLDAAAGLVAGLEQGLGERSVVWNEGTQSRL